MKSPKNIIQFSINWK